MASLIEKLLGREKGEAPPPAIAPDVPPIEPPDVDVPAATKRPPDGYEVFEAPETFGNDWPTFRPAVTARAKKLDEPFCVKEPDGKFRRGEPGDYAVVANGDLYACPADAFNAAWQPA